jgi:hypothetical protein
MVINQQITWMRDADGLGLDGASVSEMLHHCYFAYQKLNNFHGRDDLIEEALRKIDNNGEKHNKYGISLAVIGVSGAGKTSLMAKLAQQLQIRNNISNNDHDNHGGRGIELLIPTSLISIIIIHDDLRIIYYYLFVVLL